MAQGWTRSLLQKRIRHGTGYAGWVSAFRVAVACGDIADLSATGQPSVNASNAQVSVLLCQEAAGTGVRIGGTWPWTSAAQNSFWNSSDRRSARCDRFGLTSHRGLCRHRIALHDLTGRPLKGKSDRRENPTGHQDLCLLGHHLSSYRFRCLRVVVGVYRDRIQAVIDIAD